MMITHIQCPTCLREDDLDIIPRTSGFYWCRCGQRATLTVSHLDACLTWDMVMTPGVTLEIGSAEEVPGPPTHTAHGTLKLR